MAQDKSTPQKDKEKANKKKGKDTATYHGGLTYKEFKNVGKGGLELNDIAWAGRLYPKMPYWSKRLGQLVTLCFIITVLSLGIMWISVLMRSPALLLGVYPDGEVVCFPRLRNQTGQVVGLDKVYQKSCSAIDARVGRKWQLDNSNTESDTAAIGDIHTQVKYKTTHEIEEEMIQALDNTQSLPPLPSQVPSQVQPSPYHPSQGQVPPLSPSIPQG